MFRARKFDGRCGYEGEGSRVEAFNCRILLDVSYAAVTWNTVLEPFEKFLIVRTHLN